MTLLTSTWAVIAARPAGSWLPKRGVTVGDRLLAALPLCLFFFFFLN